MNKDYKKWHELKSNIENKITIPPFRELEIWWCSVGANVGDEEDGKNYFFERPVLIFRKFNQKIFWGIPLTSKKKEGIFYSTIYIHNQLATVLLSQLRIWSAKRLIRRIGKIREKQFRSVNFALLSLINKTDPFRGPQVPDGNL